MAVSKKFIDKTKKLRRREWLEVRSLWLSYQDAANSPGSPPTFELSAHDHLKRYGHKTVAPHPTDIDDDLPGLRASVLKTGIFFMQRAAHTLKHGRTGAEHRFGCPSLSSAYQAAFFAARGTAAILGVVDVAYPSTRKTYLVDVCSDRIKGDTKRLGRRYLTRIVDTDGISVNHKEFWAIFKRLIQTTRFPEDLMPSDSLNALASIDDEDFALQRNQIHYRSTYWPFDELRASTVPAQFGSIQGLGAALGCLTDTQDEAFSFALAYTIINVGATLLLDLAGQADCFRKEHDIVLRWCSEDELSDN